MPLLEDNTVLPSFMTPSGMGVGQSMNQFTNFALRSGEVREIIKTSDPRSLSGRFLEYNVEVTQMSDGTSTSMTYFNCLIANTFGGAADQFKYTLRQSDKDNKAEDGISIGSKVLILCVNGARNNAIIIGGVKDLGTDKDGSKYQGKDKDDDGHNLLFEFNGVNATINKDGELTVMYRGATDNKGKLLNGSEDSDDKAAGSKIFMKKDGSVKVSTKDDKEFVNINHDNGKIQVTASDDVELKTTGGTGIGIKIGAATDKMMLGSTYRSDETSMNNSLIQGLNQLSLQLGIVGGALATAGASMATPIGGAVAAGPQIVAASQGLTQAVSTITNMMQAITQFESKASNHLSTKNKND